MAKLGFDVSQYLSPFRGDPLGGQKMLVDAQLQGTQNVTQAARVLQSSLQQRQQDALMREQLGLRAQQLESLDAARGDAALRSRMRLGLDREKFELDQRKYQGGTDAEAVNALMSSLRRGDTNALAQAAAAVQAKDPSLKVQLPGRAAEVGTSTPDGMTFTLDEAYPEDLNKLRLLRGDQPLLEMDKAQALQNEQDMYGAAVAGLSRSPFAAMYAPAVEAGMGGVGRGATAAEQAEAATKLATNERDAFLRREGHDAMLGSRQAAQAAQAEARKLQEGFKVHGAIEKVVSDYKPQVKDLNDDSAQLQNIIAGLNSGSAWQENTAFALDMLRMTGKASTNQEYARLQARPGQWNRLQMIANGWVNGGHVPDEMLNEFREGAEALLKANQVRRMEMGEQAKNRIYASSELPLGDPERAVKAAAQAWAGLGLEPLTPEEIAQETARLRRARGMAGGLAGPAPSLAAPADGSFPAPDAAGEYVPSDPSVRDDPRLRGSGGMGGLGTTGQRPGQVPMVPQQPQSGSAEEDEAAEMLRQLEAMNAGP